MLAVGIIIALTLVVIKVIRHYMSKHKGSKQFVNHISDQKMNYPDAVIVSPDLSFRESNPRRQLGADFISRRNYLKGTFPAAYDFLCYPKSTSRTNIWMGTAVNAHLYSDNKFLAYIILKSESLIFSPRYNHRIAQGTSDQSKLLFPKLFNEIVQSLSGFDKVWAKRFPNGTFEIYEKAPNAFFDELIRSIKKLE